MSLEELREQLSALDRRLVELVAERQAVVERIGRAKLAGGHPARDFQREKRVLESVRETALELGVPPELAENLLRLLIRSSLTRQERARVKASGHGRGARALVIGGAGRMGRWFAEFLDSQGYEVEIADPAGPVGGFRHVKDWASTPPPHELVVVAAPLAASAEILETLAELRPPGVIFDIGSLKSPLREAHRKLVRAGCQATSVHPMFGPDTRLLSGRHVLFLELGDPDATAHVRSLFDSTMAEQIRMDVDDHDRLIAYVLGLSHALNVAFLTALAGSGEDAADLARLSSTTFDAQLDVAARVAAENPRLYFEIQALNAYNSEALSTLEGAVQRIASLAADGDEEGFVAMMETGRRYLERRR